MTMQTDWINQLADYRGVLTFPGFSSATPVNIPLYIKQHPIPVRKPKVSEITTIPTTLPAAAPAWTSATGAVFYGSSEPLTLQLQGWVITPTISTTINWDPTYDGSFGGVSLGLLDWSYGDVICGYMEGRLGANSIGLWQQNDPVSYTDPYGRQYASPVITAFDYEYVNPHKKQSFNLTLWLENN